MNFKKLMFLMMMILSTLITMSSNNWIGMWMGLEINLMSFIPFISKSKNKNSSQAMMIYFLTQSVGSMIMMFSIMMNTLTMITPLMTNEWLNILMIMSLLIKLGGAPFHLWLPEVMANMNWTQCFMLMTWQKMAPLSIMMNLKPNWFMYMAMTVSTMVGALGGLNQTSIRKIMAYSSINHLGWMMAMMSMQMTWYIYMIIYTMMLMTIMMMFKNIYFLNQINNSNPSLMEKMNMTMSFMSLGGLPPFIGFLPKWMVIQSMMESNMLCILIMSMMSLIILFYYMNMISPIMLNYSSMNKWMKKKNNKMLWLITLINLSFPIFSIMPIF
uniref:NADH-ubiquinone oxidoreductase chain 2 n=1 Tax=Physopelta cincticollis TaxID=238656 RepID=A0A4Y1JVS2_9HEMI|nr:NADH dehydrogenase subunit 2 [Physopelta cincticollis]APO08845.1 NADH dehydrogenase subunit 2 [Physopelta cincticollis]